MFSRILVAVDGSSDSDRAIRAATDIATAHGSAVTICHVSYIPNHYREDLVAGLRDSIREDGRRILDHAARVAAQSGVEATTRLITKGHPADGILALAEEIDASLIVAGVRGKTEDRRTALGSVSSALATRANCSLLLVRRERRQAGSDRKES